MSGDITFIKAESKDFERIWPFFKLIVEKGDTYSYPTDTTFQSGYKLWMPENGLTYLAIINEQVVGSFYLKPNQPGLGNHVANAGYMVNPDAQGRGIGKRMGFFSIQEAQKLGYQAMQFNYVVSTNQNAVKLWQTLGFNIIGTSPKSFQYKDLGLVDTYVMHRFL